MIPSALSQIKQFKSNKKEPNTDISDGVSSDRI